MIELIRRLACRVSRVYLHIDVHAIDIRDAHANEDAASGGPGLRGLLDCIRVAGEHVTIAAAAITAYDPAYNPDDRALSAARAVAREIARAVPAQPTPITG